MLEVANKRAAQSTTAQSAKGSRVAHVPQVVRSIDFHFSFDSQIFWLSGIEHGKRFSSIKFLNQHLVFGVLFLILKNFYPNICRLNFVPLIAEILKQ